jgi:hypothetical protein
MFFWWQLDEVTIGACSSHGRTAKPAISVNSLRCQKLRGGLRNTFGSQSRSLNDPLNNSPTF